MDKVLAAPPMADIHPVHVSVEFRKQVVNVVLAILLFLVVYLIMIVAGLFLSVGAIYLGFLVAIAMFSYIGIFLGIGLVGAGISLGYFLFKFILASKKDSNDFRVQITESEQPRLFAFIRELTKDVGVRFPAKIFVSDDVNAAVFYNSNFFSMFFPVRKNLDIGLGFVNCVNESEFRAVMAHEFGHFSQRSMKLGVFVFNVNRIIWNMLNDNEGYHKLLNFWARGGSIPLLMAKLTLKISQGMQWVLRQMYKIVNKRNLALSREMEFHADAVSAAVCGGNNLSSALMQVRVGSACYDDAIEFANGGVPNNKVVKNIYAGQLLMLQQIGKDKKFEVKDSLPRVSAEYIRLAASTRVYFKDQWASHPKMEDRISELNRSNEFRAPVEGSAWHLFNDAEKVQEDMTGKLYAKVDFKGKTPEVLGAVEIQNMLREAREQVGLPGYYNGFYDGRFPEILEADLNTIETTPEQFEPTDFFSADKSGLVRSIQSNQKDIALLKVIAEGNTYIETFDFDGIKYKMADAAAIVDRLKSELADQESTLHEMDLRACSFLIHRSPARREEIFDAYRRYILSRTQFLDYDRLRHSVWSRIGTFYENNNTFKVIQEGIAAFKANEEPLLKARLQQLLGDAVIFGDPEDKLDSRVKDFLAGNWVYFLDKKFVQEEMQELRIFLDTFWSRLCDRMNGDFREMLKKQLPVGAQ